MKSIIRIVAGVFLLVISAAGVYHGARAALAQSTYFIAKYGSARNNTRGILRRCETASRLYPYNYNFCVWAAETAFNDSVAREKSNTSGTADDAAYWCDRGLKLNFYNGQLRRLKTCILRENSLGEALNFWEDYVDWHFWDPYNHAVLVELYADSGDFARAAESLKLIKGTKEFKAASERLNQAWQREKIPPPDVK